jgi:hypothetical protein
MKSRPLNQSSIDVQIELYCEAHPGGPAARRHPRVAKQGSVWVAILGPNITRGIVGIGDTVDAALGAFDRHYANTFRPFAA